MMNLVKGEKSTKRQMLAYTFLLLPVAVAPAFIGLVGPLYGVIAILLSSGFIYTAFQTLRHEDMHFAKVMFGYSVFYLFAIFLALFFLT